MKLRCVSEADGGKAAKTEGKARSTVVKEITTACKLKYRIEIFYYKLLIVGATSQM